MDVIATSIALAIAYFALTYPKQNHPATITIAEGAAILYYNSPAAVQNSERIYVGYVTMDGRIEVAAVDTSGQIERTSIHEYGKPDDHGAPALWPSRDGILVATAFHSSDLFLYRVADGRVEQPEIRPATVQNVLSTGVNLSRIGAG